MRHNNRRFALLTLAAAVLVSLCLAEAKVHSRGPAWQIYPAPPVNSLFYI